MSCTQELRTRSRSTELNSRDEISRWEQLISGVWVLDHEVTVPVYFGKESTESITDTICVDSEAGSEGHDWKKSCCNRKVQEFQFKFVDHEKATFEPEQVTPVEVIYAYTPTGPLVVKLNAWYNPARSLPLVYERFNIVPDSIAVNPVDLAKAYQKVIPSVDRFFPEVNIFEILGELREVKSLLGLLDFRQVKTSPADLVMSKHLEYNFGLAPTIGLIGDIFKILWSIDQKLHQWNDFAKKGKTLNFHETIRESTEKDEWVVEHALNAVESADSTQYKAEVVTKQLLHLYVLPHEIPEHMFFMVWMQAFGFDKPLAALWELTPWSWAVDYIFNVGDLINDFEEGIDDLFQFTVVDAGISSKIDLTSYSRRSRTLHGGGVHTFPGETSTYSRFRREPLPLSGLDDFLERGTWPGLDTPSGYQWSLFLSAVGLKRQRT